MLRVAVVGGLLVGIGLDVLTWLLAAYGPQGGDSSPWSFRGNGALVVPLGLGPAVLAGAWTAFVLHARGAVRWRRLGLIAFLVGVGLIVAGIVALLAGAVAAYNWLSLAVPVWMILAPVVAAVVPVVRRPCGPGWFEHLPAAMVFTVLAVFGYFAASRVLPPGA